ncbi:MAG: HAD-IA family hydrolase [Phaeodactylibacter sp.]|nr:HAD-IA family hydrolase [Phaeodactylibacter sp.]MCB9048293.1 HAD-IA family hydrolase [Lewinellaceae bacterium]
MEDIRLLIFDLDGTLVDSRFDLGDAVNYALEKLGKPLLHYDELPPLLGSGLSYLLQKATGEVTPGTLQRARQLFDHYYGSHHADKTRCYPGVQETLAALPHLKKAVYSNKAQGFTEAIIRELGLAPYFDKVQGAQPEKYPLKPDPAGVKAILKSLDIGPEKAMMIGDSTHDLEAGKAAGLYTCAVTYGYRPADVLLKMRPDYVIGSFAELLEFLPEKDNSLSSN